ncbi:MAG: carboxyl transferase domain-containing protein [Oscillospiraceae bacterium]|nr:carboxyl transferase domain-containing protein [Oscillospiraceae bacterium]MDY6207833.1 carboxyl transferase domain-containing protein [Oscillospiraceae bacterium]
MMTDSQKSKLAEYTAAKAACPARERLSALFDDGVFTETASGRSAGGDPSGVVTAYGYINGCPAYAFSQDSTAAKGAVSRAHSEKVCRMFDLAAKNGVPVVGIYDSCGAFIEDGADALNAYSEMLLETGNLSGVVPTVSVIAGVCAGSMAVVAAAADYVVMTEGAELYAAVGGDSSAKAAAESGVVSATAENDAAAMESVRKYLSLMPQNNLSPLPEFEFDAPAAASFESASEGIMSIADEGSIVELRADFGKASQTALCTIGGTTAGIAAVGKGKLTADDCAKLAGFVRLCDAFSIPVVTVVDTEGFDMSGAESVRAAARLSGAYADATCAKIAVVSGKAYGAAFIAFAGKNAAADQVFALPEAVIAPIDPVTAAEFLYHDKLKGASDLAAERNKVAAEYAENEASAFAAAEKGAVDDVIPAESVRSAVMGVLDITAGKRLNKRLPKKHSVLPL